MKKPSMFASAPGSYTMRDDQGRVAIAVASCQFQACMNAKALWPDATAWTAAKVETVAVDADEECGREIGFSFGPVAS